MMQGTGTTSKDKVAATLQEVASERLGATGKFDTSFQVIPQLLLPLIILLEPFNTSGVCG